VKNKNYGEALIFALAAALFCGIAGAFVGLGVWWLLHYALSVIIYNSLPQVAAAAALIGVGAGFALGWRDTFRP
jgi:hypothetical protein